MVEQPFRNRKVRGSSPRIGTKFFSLQTDIRKLEISLWTDFAPLVSVVERRLCTADVAGSIPGTGHQSRRYRPVVDRILGTDDVGCSIHPSGTREWWNGRHSTFRPCRFTAMRVRSLLRAPNKCRRSQMVKATASKAGHMWVRVPPRGTNRRVAQRQSVGPTHRMSGFQNSPRLPFSCR